MIFKAKQKKITLFYANDVEIEKDVEIELDVEIEATA